MSYVLLVVGVIIQATAMCFAIVAGMIAEEYGRPTRQFKLALSISCILAACSLALIYGAA